MFLDGDDYLETDACRIAYDAIREKDTDILHFGSFVDNYAGFEEKRIENIRKMLKPCPEEIRSADLLSMCFIEKKIWLDALEQDLSRKHVCRNTGTSSQGE